MGRSRKNNVQITVYISPKSKRILEGLREGRRSPGDPPDATKNIKDGFKVSEEIEHLLELLQRDSKDRKDKKSKGWFIDRALESYVADQDEQFKRKKRTKSECVEQALKIKYRPFYDQAKSSEGFNLKS